VPALVPDGSFNRTARRPPSHVRERSEETEECCALSWLFQCSSQQGLA
jgi:hypothetical protein